MCALPLAVKCLLVCVVIQSVAVTGLIVFVSAILVIVGSELLVKSIIDTVMITTTLEDIELG